MPRAIALVVHGHFYQPPRENPWTDAFRHEPSAAPFRDWNERIHAECYRPNGFARIHGRGGRIRAVVNNYDRLSFNFGPTLARWIERHDPWAHARLVEGDAAQQRRIGFGGAVAQIWAHAIAPLLSPIDRRTQIHWGQVDFQRRFGRKPEGLWLAETGVDPATLEALIDAGLQFTILAPEQIAAVRSPGQAFAPVNRDTLDTGRAYKWFHRDGSGRSIALCIFDGPMSREIAFGGAVRDADTFLDAVEAAAARSSVSTRPLMLVASDGELYGHHKKFAELTLAYATSVEAPGRDIEVTNLPAYLASSPPTWEAQLAEGPGGEGTAWSCGHGLGRWQRHCGCAMVEAPNIPNAQAWRGPLRAGLDLLRDFSAGAIEDVGGDLFLDPWGARDAYGQVMDGTEAERLAFVKDEGRPAVQAGTSGLTQRALLLLEIERSALLMYASCGWFFDDMAGLESAIVLRQAAFVLDGLTTLGLAPPTAAMLDVLAAGRSHEIPGRTGADVLRELMADRITLPRVFAAAAMGEALGTPGDVVVPNHVITARAPDQLSVRQLRTGQVQSARVKVGHDTRGPWSVVDGEVMTLAQLPHDLRIEIVVSWSKQLARNFDPASSLPDLKRLLLTLKQREHAELTTGAPPSVPMEAGIRLALEEVARKALAQPPRATGQDEQIRTLDTLLLLLLPIPGDLMVAAQNWVGQRLTVATEVSDRKRSALPQPPVALTHGLGFAVGQDLA